MESDSCTEKLALASSKGNLWRTQGHKFPKAYLWTSITTMHSKLSKHSDFRAIKPVILCRWKGSLSHSSKCCQMSVDISGVETTWKSQLWPCPTGSVGEATDCPFLQASVGERWNAQSCLADIPHSHTREENGKLRKPPHLLATLSFHSSDLTFTIPTFLSQDDVLSFLLLPHPSLL